jgi:O-antigen/teichoic acid export membrane protein
MVQGPEPPDLQAPGAEALDPAAPDPAAADRMTTRVSRRLRGSAVVRQFGGLAGGRLAAAAVSFVWLVIVARELSFADMADLALLLSVGAIMSVVADAGYPLLLNEAVAADPDRGWASVAYVVPRRLVLGVVAVLGTAVMYLVAAQNQSVVVPAVFALSILCTICYTSFAAALRGMGRVGPDAWNELLSRVLLLVLGVILLSRGLGLVPVVLLYVLADALSFAALLVVARRGLPRAAPVDRSRFRLRRVAPLGLASLAGLAYFRLDLWLLAVIGNDDAAVATYSVCYRILDGLAIPAGALAMVSVGATARLDVAAAKRTADKMAAFLCLLLSPAVLLLLAAPASILSLLFGAKYADGATVLRILAVAVIPTVSYLVWAPLVGLRGSRLLPIMVVSLVVNIGLNVVLIPRYGAEGAAIATLVGQAGLAVALRWSLRGDRLGSLPAEGAVAELAADIEDINDLGRI